MNIQLTTLSVSVLFLVASSHASAAATEPAHAPIPAGVTRVLSGAHPDGWRRSPATLDFRFRALEARVA